MMEDLPSPVLSTDGDEALAFEGMKPSLAQSDFTVETLRWQVCPMVGQFAPPTTTWHHRRQPISLSDPSMMFAQRSRHHAW